MILHKTSDVNPGAGDRYVHVVLVLYKTSEVTPGAGDG